LPGRLAIPLLFLAGRFLRRAARFRFRLSPLEFINEVPTVDHFDRLVVENQVDLLTKGAEERMLTVCNSCIFQSTRTLALPKTVADAYSNGRKSDPLKLFDCKLACPRAAIRSKRTADGTLVNEAQVVNVGLNY
jgi:hypothetical protein